MNNEQKRLAILAMVKHSKGGDLERANREFASMTDVELDKRWRGGVHTCRQIWQQYKDSRANFEECVRYLGKMIAYDRIMSGTQEEAE